MFVLDVHHIMNFLFIVFNIYCQLVFTSVNLCRPSWKQLTLHLKKGENDGTILAQKKKKFPQTYINLCHKHLSS